MLENTHTEGHPSTQSLRSKLAWCLFKQSKFDQCQEIFDKSIEVVESQLYKEWPDIAETFQELADINSKLARFDQV